MIAAMEGAQAGASRAPLSRSVPAQVVPTSLAPPVFEKPTPNTPSSQRAQTPPPVPGGLSTVQFDAIPSPDTPKVRWGSTPEPSDRAGVKETEPAATRLALYLFALVAILALVALIIGLAQGLVGSRSAAVPDLASVQVPPTAPRSAPPSPKEAPSQAVASVETDPAAGVTDAGPAASGEAAAASAPVRDETVASPTPTPTPTPRPKPRPVADAAGSGDVTASEASVEAAAAEAAGSATEAASPSVAEASEATEAVPAEGADATPSESPKEAQPVAATEGVPTPEVAAPSADVFDVHMLSGNWHGDSRGVPMVLEVTFSEDGSLQGSLRLTDGTRVTTENIRGKWSRDGAGIEVDFSTRSEKPFRYLGVLSGDLGHGDVIQAGKTRGAWEVRL